jgi:hypothetical protein
MCCFTFGVVSRNRYNGHVAITATFYFCPCIWIRIIAIIGIIFKIILTSARRMRIENYQAYMGLGFRRGTSSRTNPAETMRFNLRSVSSLTFSAWVLPGRKITCIRESGCVRMPNLPRPLGSNLFNCFGPLVTHASAVVNLVSMDVKKPTLGISTDQ